MRSFLLGTDWWTDCDDVAALRLLARAHKSGRIRLLGIGINACMEHSVTSLEGFLNTEDVRDIPIGIDPEATDFGGNPPYQKRLSAFAERYRRSNDAEDAVTLYRTVLAKAASPVELIEIGYPQVLAALLQSKPDGICDLDGIALVKQNVSKIWMMAGKWDENPGRENNFARNVRSAAAGHIFCRLCPVPITFLGWEAGASVITGGDLPKDDILHLAMADHGSPNGRSSWDPMLCLLALIGDESSAGYLLVRGKASVDAATGENTFTPNPDGLHGYVVKQHPDTCYADTINRLLL